MCCRACCVVVRTAYFCLRCRCLCGVFGCVFIVRVMSLCGSCYVTNILTMSVFRVVVCYCMYFVVCMCVCVDYSFVCFVY